MALIVTHLQDKKSVYLQDKDGNEVEFVRVDTLRKLVVKWRAEYRENYLASKGSAAEELEELYDGGE